MQPFRELVRPNAKFEWNSNLEKLFSDSKEILIQQSVDGIQAFQTDRNTCLQTDWSKEGIGYLLLQQHCQCEPSKAPVCCKDGWKLVFAGSRFTHPAETRYSPTEGEALAIAWSLEHSKMFVLGCDKLIISTDHKPLIGILQNRELSTIQNPRILNLKERTLPYHFTIQHNPGKWHRGPDAFSRNPVHNAEIHAHFTTPESSPHCEMYEEQMNIQIQSSIAAISEQLITIADLEQAAISDPEYMRLHHAVGTGFPKIRGGTEPDLRQYWSVRNRLSLFNNLVMMDERIVVPVAHRPVILRNLHSAHQGANSMIGRARHTVYWPGIDTAIRNTRYNCHKCNELAPSQSKEPISMSPPPLFPFQRICMDFFQLGHRNYLSIVDRFSGWIIVCHFSNRTTSSELITVCRELFNTYGVPEEISSDGGTQFTSDQFQQFLKDWGICHRRSSAEYPQSNGRAELAVKSAKRIIRDNISPNGSLDNDRVVQAIMQHRNTPIPELGLSPAQLLLHRQLRDHIPSSPKHYLPHKNWIISSDEREKSFAERNIAIEKEYDGKSHPLKQLDPQTHVIIMTNGLWNKTGRIVEVLPHRQYRIRVDGSGRTTLRNRRFLKAIPCNPTPDPAKPAEPPQEADDSHTGAPPTINAPPINAPPEIDAKPDVAAPPVAGTQQRKPTPKALRDIADHNNPGLREAPGVQRQGRTRSGRL